MEITITKRLPLTFDANGSAIVEFDFKALQEEHEGYSINKSSQVVTITGSHILHTFKATERGESGIESGIKTRAIRIGGGSRRNNW